jgi:hypothetical protein
MTGIYMIVTYMLNKINCFSFQLYYRKEYIPLSSLTMDKGCIIQILSMSIFLEISRSDTS